MMLLLLILRYPWVVGPTLPISVVPCLSLIPPRSPTVDSKRESGRTFQDHRGLEHIPSTAKPFATSLPYTLACAGTCSHCTYLPCLLICCWRSSHTGMFVFKVAVTIVQPLDFHLWALPLVDGGGGKALAGATSTWVRYFCGWCVIWSAGTRIAAYCGGSLITRGSEPCSPRRVS